MAGPVIRWGWSAHGYEPSVSLAVWRDSHRLSGGSAGRRPREFSRVLGRRVGKRIGGSLGAGLELPLGEAAGRTCWLVGGVECMKWTGRYGLGGRV